jgi:luciferase family oxidoreductase group 1
MYPQIPFSVLDVSPVRSGETPREALQQTVDLARHVEALSFKRFWVAEHHGIMAFASAAPSVIVGHVAGKTSTIRVGSGGVMLRNHPPLVIAEQFGTLASLYPGRIDLGVGRATETSQETLRALRRGPENADSFPSDVRELQSFFREAKPGQKVQAVPGAGLDVPIWLLGSSTFSAEHAGTLGLPFAHRIIGPDVLGPTLDVYRSSFKASDALDKPHVMIAVHIVAAETEEIARHLFTSFQQALTAMLSSDTLGPLPPPIHDIGLVASREEQARLEGMLPFSIVGSRETVRRGLEALIAKTAADEIIVLTLIYDQDARRRSFEIVAEARDGIAAQMRAS